MTKVDIVNAVAEKTGYTKKEIKAIVDATFDSVIDIVVGGDECRISGFGTICTVERAARTSKSIRTGKPITVEAHNVVRFKPSKAFKESVK